MGTGAALQGCWCQKYSTPNNCCFLFRPRTDPSHYQAPCCSLLFLNVGDPLQRRHSRGRVHSSRKVLALLKALECGIQVAALEMKGAAAKQGRRLQPQVA